ncbi:MAG: hypothetical protein APR54_03315 [Candidatus Cloacimonas sp. SDB]|nr:MAG: hypothetical protein APR54_03315 [Candidatus Cloacimonas sp. SDB]
MKDFLKFIITIFLIIIFFRFFRIIFLLMFKFWFITIPVLLIIYFNFKHKLKTRKEFNDLDPDKEIKVYPEPTVEDDDEKK